jgi:putative membrane protein
MNWSVVISGFLYWNLILDRRPHPPAALSPGARILSPVITMVPQMVVGAVITFTEHDLYPIFDLCGRAIPGMTAITDQTIGGLTMWVLAGFIEVFGLLFALATMLRLSGKNRIPNKQDLARRRRASVLPAS